MVQSGGLGFLTSARPTSDESVHFTIDVKRGPGPTSAANILTLIPSKSSPASATRRWPAAQKKVTVAFLIRQVPMSPWSDRSSPISTRRPMLALVGIARRNILLKSLVE